MNQVPETSFNYYARVAGLTYVIVILLGIFSVSFIDSHIIVRGDNAKTFSNAMANERQYRVSVASEVLMYALVVILSTALYIVLKSVNSNLALLALLFRLGEAIIGASASILGGIMPLLLIDRTTEFETQQLQAMAGLFLDIRNAGLDIILVFVGIGGTLFCYLFFKSKLVPRILAAWGMFTYLSMLVLAFTSMLVPDLPESIKLIFYTPGGLFELLFGFWLLFKGVNIHQSDSHTFGSS